MTQKATLMLENPKMETIVSSLGKISSFNTERMTIKTTDTETTLTVNITAKDSIALRAGLNSFMNLYNLSDNMIKGISDGRRK
ncbi:MAG: hypothetical protein KAI18_00950 [Candidatus Aenigmarchaeota archaeon]|nr:hypothetical protein [Candidatus Aenigmarchaeota archaeon]